ncbi:hypothetical protein [Collinsella sp. LCP19S3_B11]|uniref:hypothetical protein n=1 Tax=Collinsella sp. LCP19S3_B11 TaxID=3438754 RepID=UPI003F8DBC6B
MIGEVMPVDLVIYTLALTIDKLKAAEPWLFGVGAAAPAQAGATGLSNAGAATDAGAQMRRWRKIAGIEGDEE